MQFSKALAMAAALAATTMPTFAAPVAIGRGDPLRKELLDSMRPTVEDDLGIPVQFVVDILQVEDGWAFFAGMPQHKDGSAIDFEETRYAEAITEGVFDGPTLKVLLEETGDGWQVASFSIGATDVVEAGWPDEFGVPCTLVGFC